MKKGIKGIGKRWVSGDVRKKKEKEMKKEEFKKEKDERKKKS